MNRVQSAYMALGVTIFALSACSDNASVSGRYVAGIEGNSMEINFLDGSKATFGMQENGQGDTVDCTYQVGETLITLKCLGSSGITLTRVDGGLEADMGGVLVLYKRR